MKQIYYYYLIIHREPMIVSEPCGYAVLLLITIIQKWNKYIIIIIMITPLGPWAVRSIYLHAFLHGVLLRVYS